MSEDHRQPLSGGPISSNHLVSIVVPVYRTPRRYLTDMVNSVLDQIDPNWELVLVDDHSEDADLTTALDGYAAAHDRITVVVHEHNGGIGKATRTGIDVARGDLIALLDHDDLLTEDCVEVIRSEAFAHPEADVLYSDEYRVDENGRDPHRFLKPAFSPERLRAQMYLGHIVTYRAALLRHIGSMREGLDGSQDYDLALRATEQAREVHHIPRCLYKWRIHESSVSHRKSNEPVFAAARKALSEHLERVGISGRVEQTHSEGVYRIHRDIDGAPLVSIVIPTRGSAAKVLGRSRTFVVEAVRSIVGKSTYPHIQIVVVWDSGMDQAIADELLAIAGSRLKFVEYTEPFNFSRKINVGACAADGDYLLLLNDDIDVIDADWIEVLLGLCQRPEIGMAGAFLFFEDGTLQHAGHLYTGYNAGHIGVGLAADAPGTARELQVEREVSGVTAACAMIPTDLFFELGGMSTVLPVNFNDVDLSLKVRQSGYSIVVTPYARLYHYESKSRKAGWLPFEWDEVHARWGRWMLRDSYEPYANGQ